MSAVLPIFRIPKTMRRGRFLYQQLLLSPFVLCATGIEGLPFHDLRHEADTLSIKPIGQIENMHDPLTPDLTVRDRCPTVANQVA